MKQTLLHTLISLVLVAGTAYAAPPAPVERGPAPDRLEQRAFARPTERIEARLAYVKTALKITEAQQPQWNAYAAEMRKLAQQREQRWDARRAGRAAPGAAPANAIERLERAQSFHAEAVTRINELLAVQKPLYAALSPEQKQVADVVLAPRRHGPGRGFQPGRGGYGRG